MSVRLVLYCDRDMGNKRNELVVHVGRCSAPSLWALQGNEVGSLQLLPYTSYPAWEVDGICFFYMQMFAGEQ